MLINSFLLWVLQGFIFISSVIDNEENLPGTRSGLSYLYKIATESSRLLVVSRVSNQKVLPWMVSSTGAIRCYDTVSISQKLSLHRHTGVAIVMHLFLWDTALASSSGAFPVVSPSVLPSPPQVHQLAQHSNQIHPLLPEPSNPDLGEVINDASLPRIERDTAGEFSFRFHDFSFSSNWV